MTDAPEWTLTLKDWRGLPQVEWSPRGVILLSGPNGSGKTSVLEAVAFLRNAWHRGVFEALRFSRGPSYLRRLGADAAAPVHMELKVGDLSWQLQLGVEGSGIHAYHGEVVKIRDQVLVRRALFSAEWYLGTEKRGHEDRTCLRALWDARSPDERAELGPLVDFVDGIRTYGPYQLDAVRRAGDPSDQASTHLHPTGRDLLWVLRNWKTADRRFNGQFSWVLNHAREAFPDQLADLEFVTLGQAIEGRFYPVHAQNPDDNLPVHLAADGLITGLLHLAAIAGARSGSVVAFDEVENQLHPHAIRAILRSMRARAEEKGLTVILTTHSPIVMNEFKGYEDQFFVLDRNVVPTPTPLDQLRDPDWLAHFALGDLYERNDFAAPEPPDA